MCGKNLGAFVLAAGFSTRMGDFKPLMRLEGRTLVEWAIRAFHQAGLTQVFVVTGHRGDELDAEIRRCGAQRIHNPDPGQGMFSSVRCVLQATHGLDGFFLLPVDIPLARPATIKALCAAWEKCQAEHPVLYPSYQGQRGHPPLIPAWLVPAIAGHDGTGGLHTVLEQHLGQDVPVWDRGVLLDADTGSDFTLLQHKAERLHLGEREEIQTLADLTMPKRGVAHGQAVTQVALRLAEKLGTHGLALDLDLVHNAALLHDIAKSQPDHEQAGGHFVSNLGLTGLAPIVASHRDVPPPAKGLITEKELVCLADKLVRCDKRVSVEARFGEKLAQYAGDEAAQKAILGRMRNALALQKLVETRCGENIEDILAGVFA
ncbi:NTP transferase domain-containing protein [Desulfovibrionales bacterium]